MKTSLKPEDINEVIADESYHQFDGTTLTVCCLTLDNGHAVIGKSACIDPANFDKELGEKLAKEDAVRHIWELEAYLLQTKLFLEN